MKKVLITGGNGQVGMELRSILKDHPTIEPFFFTRSIFDLTDFEALNKFLLENKFDTIVNCSAWTNVEAAEDKENGDALHKINVWLPTFLAHYSKDNNVDLIHISTDYVFDGSKSDPYTESDTASPTNLYGVSKDLGEKQILKYNENAIIIRSGWVYSSHRNNFLNTICRLASSRSEINVIYDQVGCPTYAYDLSVAIVKIIENFDLNKKGIYHFSNEGVASWYDFAKAIVDMFGYECKVNPILSKEYTNTVVTRPYYTVLNKNRIKKDFDLIIPYWRDSLWTCIQKIKNESL